MRSANTWLALLSIAAPLGAQATADAIADLARPERAVAACHALQQLGYTAVMPLRQLLQQSRVDGATFDQAQVQLALYVLGRLAGKATAALPEVEQIYRDQGPAALRNQALWALGELAPASGQLSTCRDCEKLLVDQWTQDLDAFLGAVVRRQLQLGPFPDVQQLQQRLSGFHDTVYIIAAARAVAAGRGPLAPVQAQFWRLLSTAMQDAMLPPAGQCRWSAAAGDLAVALADRGGMGKQLVVQRGLLRSWDPDRRRIALAQLLEQPQLELVARADIVALLSDPDRAVCMQAVRTLRHLGRGGLVGLTALRQGQRGPDADFAAACAQAADAVVTDTRAGLQGNIAIALLAELDGIARGHHPPGNLPFDAEATALWAEVTAGARGAGAGVCSALLDLGLARGAGGEDAAVATVAAMYGGDRQLARRGMQLLARIGKPVENAFSPDGVLAGVVASDNEHLGAVLECKAWIEAGRGASNLELQTLLSHPMLRVRLRALVELAGRGALPPAQQLSPIGVVDEPWAMLRTNRGGCGFDQELVRPSADLILGLCGAAGSDTRAFRQLVHERFAVPLDEVPRWVAQVRASGQLHQRLLEVEAMLRRDLKIGEDIAPR